MDPEVLIVSYHDFFHRNEACIPLLSQFLDLEFDGAARRSWRRMSRRFEERRRDKEPLDERQARFIAKNKSYAAEEWVLERIERQWKELERTSGADTARPRGGKAEEGSRTTDGLPGRESKRRLRERKRRIGEPEGDPLEERGGVWCPGRQNQRIEPRVRGLARWLEGIKSRVLKRLRR